MSNGFQMTKVSCHVGCGTSSAAVAAKGLLARHGTLHPSSLLQSSDVELISPLSCIQHAGQPTTLSLKKCYGCDWLRISVELAGRLFHSYPNCSSTSASSLNKANEEPRFRSTAFPAVLIAKCVDPLKGCEARGQRRTRLRVQVATTRLREECKGIFSESGRKSSSG